MTKEKTIRYWVVSPNVRKHQWSLGDWKDLIKQTGTAIMGWSPTQKKGMRLGSKFANDIEKNDVILIARGRGANREIVGCGRVASSALLPQGKDETLLKLPNKSQVQAPESFGSYRLLDPFVVLEGQKWPSFKGVTYQIWAMYELKPVSADDARLCKWLDSKLAMVGKGSTKKQKEKTKKGKSTQLMLPTTEPYFVVTKAEAKRIENAEAKLVNQYAGWLLRTHKREALPHSLPVVFSVDGVSGHVSCDLYDEERRIMIEAKSTTDRHNIRMAIGQLFDYSNLMQLIRGKTVKRAMLLPKRLDSSMEEFLKSIGIASIWKDRKSFVDNIGSVFPQTRLLAVKD
jgi:hypothetical protein